MRIKSILGLGKKGSLVDIPIGIIFGFVIAVIFIVGLIVVQNVVPPITSTSGFDPAIAGEIDDQVNNRALTLYESMFLVIFVGFYMGSLALAFLIDTHPILFALAIIVWIISIPLAAIMANAFAQVNESLSAYTIDLVIIPWIFQNYVLVLIVLAVPILYVMYGKTKS